VNKKGIVFFLILLSMMLLLGGCSGTKESSRNVKQSATTGNLSNNNSNPEKRKADIYGKVQSILGNEVTLLVAEIPQREETSQGQRQSMSAEEREQRRAEFQNINPEERQQMRQKMMENIKFTGETEIFIIPVGTPIVSAGRGNARQDIKELNLADIHEGTILQIWFREGETGEDRTVEYVQVMQAGG